MHIYKLYTYGIPCIYTVQLHLITGSLFGCFRLFRLFEAQCTGKICASDTRPETGGTLLNEGEGTVLTKHTHVDTPLYVYLYMCMCILCEFLSKYKVAFPLSHYHYHRNISFILEGMTKKFN